MRTSATVKILLALFLGAFVWYVFISIQAPRASAPQETPAPELRRELLSLMEDVFLEIGSIKVTAAVQENYKNGELHFRDFKMVREDETRTIEITGVVAQTRLVGSEIEFIEMHGDDFRDVQVITSDGLDLTSRTLNYVDAQKRIFTQTPASFTLNNLKGRADSFSYDTEKNVLELQGNVEATYYPENGGDSTPPPAEEARTAETGGEETTDADGTEQNADGPVEEETAGAGAEIQPIEQRPTEISCQRLVYDQGKHKVLLVKRVRLTQQGGFLRSERILADLTEDNTQFVQMVATGVRSRLRDGSEDGKTEEAETEVEGEQATLSDRTAGIKSLSSRKLTLQFATGESNELSSAIAEGKAVLQLEPRAEQKTEKRSERKILSADRIEAAVGPGGIGISSLYASSTRGPSQLRIEPLGRRKKTRGGAGDEEPKAKTMAAPEITAEIDPETGGFSTVLMSGGIEMRQGDTVITGSTARLLVSLSIGDLAADGNVRSAFFPPEDEAETYVFAIGDEPEETGIAAGSLRLDYRNNVLRYTKGVRALQGDSAIDSDALTIYQTESRLIATGKVRANLIVPSAEAVEAGQAEGAGEAAERDHAVPAGAPRPKPVRA